MSITALLIIVKMWKHPKYPTESHVNKMWYIHTVEYYSAIKWNEVLMYATRWMNLKDMLTDRRRTQVTYCRIPFIGHIQNS